MIQSIVNEPAVEAADESLCTRPDSPELLTRRKTAPKVPKPPPMPSATKLHHTWQMERSQRCRCRCHHDLHLFHQNCKTGVSGIPLVANTKNMIREIENHSAYLMAIKSDVENQRDFIGFLTSRKCSLC